MYLRPVHFQINGGIENSQSISQSMHITSRINKIYGLVVWVDSQINTSQSISQSIRIPSSANKTIVQ
jgi:hypothetical protein